MMKNKLSMMIAAGGLLVVAVLAAALFSGRRDAANEEKKETSKADSTPKLELSGPTLAQTLGYPQPKPEEVAPPPVVVAPETPPKDKAPAPSATALVEHKVVSGDRVAKIAEKYGVKVEDIYACNDGLDASTAARIRVGQVIKVPSSPEAARALSAKAEAEKPTGFAERVVKAEAGDTAYSLAIEYYGSRSLFRMIMRANPDLPWADRLKGGEEVKLPAWGQTVAAAPKAETPSKPATTVERKSIIPPRK